MRIVTIPAIQLQFDTLGGVDYNEIDAQAVIAHINDVLQQHSLIMQPKLTLTSESKVTIIDPIVLPKN